MSPDTYEKAPSPQQAPVGSWDLPCVCSTGGQVACENENMRERERERDWQCWQRKGISQNSGCIYTKLTTPQALLEGASSRAARGIAESLSRTCGCSQKSHICRL